LKIDKYEDQKIKEAHEDSH